VDYSLLALIQDINLPVIGVGSSDVVSLLYVLVLCDADGFMVISVAGLVSLENVVPDEQSEEQFTTENNALNSIKIFYNHYMLLKQFM